METHDSWPFGDERSQHRIVFNEAAIDLLQPHRRPGAKPFEVRAQMRKPCCFEGCISLRRLMTEHIHIERATGACPDFCNHSSRALAIRRADANRPERTGIRNRRSHRRRGHSRHWRLNDRQIDPECFEWGHARTPPVRQRGLICNAPQPTETNETRGIRSYRLDERIARNCGSRHISDTIVQSNHLERSAVIALSHHLTSLFR